MDNTENHDNVVALLQNAFTSISQLAEYNEFIYNIFYHTFKYDLELIEAITTGKKLNADDAIFYMSKILNVDIKTMVERTISQLNAEKKLKAGLGDLSESEKELAKRIADGYSTVDDFKKFDFDKFISDIDLGELDGNTDVSK